MEQIDSIKDKVSEHVNKKNIIICIVLLCIGLFLGWYVFGADVHDNGGTANTAREQLDRVDEYQRDTIGSITEVRDGIDSTIESVERAEERIEDSEESANRIQEQIEYSNDLIRESKSRIEESVNILEEIRKTKRQP